MVRYKYLRSVIEESADMRKDIIGRVKGKATSGVLYDRQDSTMAKDLNKLLLDENKAKNRIE